MSTADSKLEAALRGLRVEAPARLSQRLVAHFASVPSLIGELFVAWTESGICTVTWARSTEGVEAFLDEVRDRCGRPVVASAQLPAGVAEAAASGQARQLRFDLSGLTPFEADVLEATQTIPLGEVRPYAWVAGAIGRPKAVRAVGSALGRNPVPILIPCHRVTRSDGSIGQYGGGPEMKEELLRAEQVNLDEVLDLARRRIHFVGNTATGVVCLPSCPGIRHVSPGNRQGFASRAAAEAAGYRPCQHCRPDLAATA